MRLNLSKSAASNVWWFVQPHKTNEKPSEPVPDSCQSKNRHKSKYVQCLLCPWSVILFSWSVDSDWILTIIKQGEMVSTLGEQLGYGINNLRTYEKNTILLNGQQLYYMRSWKIGKKSANLICQKTLSPPQTSLENPSQWKDLLNDFYSRLLMMIR